MRDSLVRVRVSEGERELWVAAAGFESLSSWMRRVLNEAAGGGPVMAGDSYELPGGPETVTRRRLARTSMCVHRVPAGSFCKVCDE